MRLALEYERQLASYSEHFPQSLVSKLSNDALVNDLFMENQQAWNEELILEVF